MIWYLNPEFPHNRTTVRQYNYPRIYIPEERQKILSADNHFFFGISGRTNNAGAAQLSSILAEYGYSASEIEVGSGLHLKSGIAYLGDGNYITVKEFSEIAGSANYIIPDQDESYSANCLRVNNYLLVPERFPETKRKITDLGYSIIELDMSEFHKMDGGMTCLSLVF